MCRSSAQTDEDRILERWDPTDEHLRVLVCLQRVLEGLERLGVSQDDLVGSPDGNPTAPISLDAVGSHVSEGIGHAQPDRGSDRDGFIEHPVAKPRLQHRGGNDVDVHAEEVGQLLLEAGKANERHAVIEIYQQVHIARRTIVASGNAAEDAEVASAAPLGRGEWPSNPWGRSRE